MGLLSALGITKKTETVQAQNAPAIMTRPMAMVHLQLV
jgi:hypothetical protein